MTRLEKVCALFRMHMEYQTEAEMLQQTKLFLDMIPDLYYRRIGSPQSSGLPDLIVCYTGRFIALELKDNSGKPSKLQKVEMSKIIESGGTAAICKTLQEVKDAIFIKE